MEDIFAPSAAYKRMQAKRALTETLWAGTEAMRDAAREGKYLWPAEGEGKMVRIGAATDARGNTTPGTGMVSRFELRIRESILEPLWKEGVQGAASMPFRRPWTFEGWHELVTGSYQDGKLVKPGLLQNADMTGRTGLQMLHQSLELAEAHGMDLILVDLPGPDAPSSTRGPYWSHVFASDLLDTVVDYKSGYPRLEIARLKRRHTMRDESLAWRPEEEEVEIVKVFYAGALDAPAGSDEAKAHCEVYDQEGILRDTLTIAPPSGDFREIPLVPIYGGKVAPFEAYPPYYDQAELMAAYWRKRSKYDSKVKAAATTVVGQTGVDYDAERPGGGAGVEDDAILWVADPAGKNEFLETTGTALEALREDLEILKKSTREGTMQATLSRPQGDVTAFEIGVGLVRANSRIEADTMFLEGSTRQLLEYTSLMWGLSGGGSVSIPHDFGVPAAGIERAASLYEKGKLTPEGFLPVAKEAGWFPDNWNVDAEITRLNARKEQSNG